MADDAPLLIHSLEEEAEDSLILISPLTEPSLEQRLPDGGLPAPPLQLLRDLSLPPVSARVSVVLLPAREVRKKSVVRVRVGVRLVVVAGAKWVAWSGEGREAVTGGEQGGLGRKASQDVELYRTIEEVSVVCVGGGRRVTVGVIKREEEDEEEEEEEEGEERRKTPKGGLCLQPQICSSGAAKRGGLGQQKKEKKEKKSTWTQELTLPLCVQSQLVWLQPPPAVSEHRGSSCTLHPGCAPCTLGRASEPELHSFHQHDPQFVTSTNQHVPPQTPPSSWSLT
ncbi:hypothetical protein F7725_014075 [Dissostichus mawsoni]|uniref:Uncharacterized protein n=1 Tax=Dissostichus mawsoni TaxID=36200 RepID=A0A7J5YY20_DISMA|nr:hypothetical protein F7725_014075 [Dissostichus mawsoni]